jgi:hypothetical protein
LGVFGISRPLNASVHQRDPERAKKLTMKRATKCYISRMRRGALIPPISVVVCTAAKVTNLINRANVDGCRLKVLVTAKGRI